MENVNKQLLDAMKGLLEFHDNPAPFCGKTGEERMFALENQAAKRNALIYSARQAIAAAEQAQQATAQGCSFTDRAEIGVRVGGQQQAEPVQLKVAANNWPKQCPITRRDFFMEIDGVPTYGGPYDSYTIPEMTGQPDQPWHERELFVRRYDHDFGSWVEDEFIPLRVIHEDVLMELEDAAEAAKAEPAAPAVKESLTAEPQAELATLCASCARADVNCPIYPQQTASCVEHRPAAQQQAEPVAFDVFCTDDDALTQTIRATDVCRLEHYRKSPRAWRLVPLYAQPPAVADGCIPIPAEWIEGLLLGDRQRHIELRAMLAAAPQAAVPETAPDLAAQLRALAKQHGWNFVWSKARLIEEGTKTCHKCHNGALTHSSLCVHYDKAKEQAAMAEYRAARKGGEA